jgi:hypothetical protein
LDIALKRALAAAARAFAEELERDLGEQGEPTVADRRQGMLEVLSSVARVNDQLGRGASDEEMRHIARCAGMDPRGIAGYHVHHLLELRDDGGRWLTPNGQARLAALLQTRMVRGNGHGKLE